MIMVCICCEFRCPTALDLWVRLPRHLAWRARTFMRWRLSSVLAALSFTIFLFGQRPIG